MNPDVVAGIVSAIGVVMSWLIAGLVSSRKAAARDATMELRVALLESNQDKLATKEQLAGVKEDLAEIKGMFRITLKPAGSDGSN